MNTVSGTCARVALVTIAGFAACLPARASEIIVCSSQSNQTQRCPADTSGGVSLETQYSRSGCYQGSTWGFDSSGIWVSNGCRAEFHVGSPVHAHASSDASSAAAVVAAAAIIGLAAAAAASSDHHSSSNSNSHYRDMANKEWQRSGGDSYGYYGNYGHSYDIIRCESRSSQHTRCPAMVSRAHVEIQRQLSKSNCRYGEDWHYDKSAIYVRNGCRAEFRIEP